jgi:photosystem II stability/assembly factor-like uncharacterized protein
MMNSRTNYLRIALLALIFLSNSVYSQAGWNDVTPAGTYPGLLGVYALDSDNVWVVGQEGTILNTTNGGITWSEISCPVAYTLYNVHFINADTGWVGGDNPSITEVMRTMDKGVSWVLKTLRNSSQGNHDIEFKYGNQGEPPRGFVTAGLSYVWTTDDYGENWVTLPIGGCGANSLLSISFVNKDEGWFVGERSVSPDVTIVHTTDGGQTYETQTNPTEPDDKMTGVSFATNQQGVAVGVSGTILYTSDGGQNWEIRPNSGNSWWSVFLTESGKAWAVGLNGNIAYSTDWGYTWTSQQSGVSCHLWEVFFVNDNEGWIVGGGSGQPGVILHTTNGGITDIQDPINNAMDNYRLYQNYPNPFNPVTTIEFDLPKSAKVTLKIFNILGEEVTTLLSESLPSGFHSCQWDARNYPSGIYYYLIQAGDFRDVKKMVLMK